MSHICVDDDKLTDPYFTPEEWDSVLQKQKQNLSIAKELLLREDISVEERREWVEKEENSILCNCIVHSHDDKYRKLARLIEVTSPLTDDSGFRVMESLIIDKAGMGDNMVFESVRSGANSSVCYILQLPSGETSMYTGWPDFRAAQTFERRLGRNILRREETTRAVGEIQSPQGMSQEVKMDSLAQSGINAIGQFARLRGIRKRKIAAIVWRGVLYSSNRRKQVAPE